MASRRPPGPVPGPKLENEPIADAATGEARGPTGFTVLLMGYDRENLCCIVEPVYVIEALNRREAGWLAAEAFEAETGIPVQPLYAAAGRVELEKLSVGDMIL